MSVIASHRRERGRKTCRAQRARNKGSDHSKTLTGARRAVVAYRALARERIRADRAHSEVKARVRVAIIEVCEQRAQTMLVFNYHTPNHGI